jgi:glycerol-3-phosphate acyltransferase PlsY
VPDPISWELAWPYYLAALALGYLLGSIPFGVLITRLAGAGDLRKVGSGNIGATNVLRTGRKDLAALTLLGDALKGVAAVLIARTWGPDTAVIAGVGAFLGHLFPVWLRFRGGKGVATYLGVVTALAWPAGLVFAAVWLATAYLTRYSSLSALVASLAVPAFLWLTANFQVAEATVLLSLLLWLKHAGNIRRLATGRESRIGAKG